MPEARKIDMDRVCTCLFCGKSFPVREITFAKDIRMGAADQKDEEFEKAIKGYKLFNGDVAVEIPYRQFFDWKEENVDTCEEVGDGLYIPASVRVSMPKAKPHRAANGLMNNKKAAEEQTETEEDSDTVIITTRLCPKCHMTLPKGFASERIRRVGLIGGSRCGKTTYMVVAAKYIKDVFGLAGEGMNLGTVEYVPESKKYLDRLYGEHLTMAGEGGTPAENSGLMDPPVFPIAVHIRPTNHAYAPFYLVFQDIPGEYLLPEFEPELLNSAIPLSTDLISLVDINSLEYMQKDVRYGDTCTLELSELFDNFGGLGERFQETRTLETTQICITKLDVWKDKKP